MPLSDIEIIEKIRGGAKHYYAQIVDRYKDRAFTLAVRMLKSKEDAEEFEDHAWFVAIGPVENPALALAIVVEHGGHGGSVAAPMAKEMFEAYLAKNE